MKRDSILTLYRVCTLRDKENGYILDSACKEKLTNERLLQEIVSHELNARTGRGVFYSFTYDYELAKGYKLRNPENTEICSIDVDLLNLPLAVKSIFPIYSRDYLMTLICSTPEVLDKGAVKNPTSGRYHTILGILNTSQRTVSGWANSMKEIVIQCDHLKLEVLTGNHFSHDEDKISQIIKENFITQPNMESIKKFRDIINSSYMKANCTRSYLVERVNGDDWYKAA